MKPILTILEPEHFSPTAMDRLKEHFYTVGGDWPKAEVLWARLGGVDLERHPVLKAIACNMTDISHLPLAECQRRGIEVLSLRGIEGLDTVHATAEHTISLMLQALRHRCDRSSGRIGRELRGKSVGIVGYGRIARQVERLLEAFGAQVFLHTDEQDQRWPCTCDIISIHASLNETSRGMVNAEFLSKLKPGCVLVNTARHAIVDRDAVLSWLSKDKVAIYAHDFTDDFEHDWTTKALYTQAGVADRIISTPHIGGWTIESLHKTEELLAERVIEWAKSKLEVAV